MDILIQYDVQPDGKDTYVECVLNKEIEAEDIIKTMGMIIVSTYLQMKENGNDNIKKGAEWIRKEYTKIILNDAFWDGDNTMLPKNESYSSLEDHHIMYNVKPYSYGDGITCETGEDATYSDILFALCAITLYARDLLEDSKDEIWNMLTDLFIDTMVSAVEMDSFWNNKMNIVQIANIAYKKWGNPQENAS